MVLLCNPRLPAVLGRIHAPGCQASRPSLGIPGRVGTAQTGRILFIFHLAPPSLDEEEEEQEEQEEECVQNGACGSVVCTA